MPTNDPSRVRLKQTRSRCPVCLLEVPADLVEANGTIVMRKRCEHDGDFESLISRHPRFYYPSLGDRSEAGAGGCCSSSCGCGPAPAGADGAISLPSVATDADPFESLSTCIALIEIVDSCNLTCPTCFASSPHGVGQFVNATPFEEFTRRVGGVLKRKGFIDILQLSGGEPTIHPEFFRLLEWALDQQAIGYVLINTNAVRLATDAPFREKLAALRRERGRFELYVQFDGVQIEGQQELRGADLRDVRRQAIDSCGKLGVPSTLAMVVTPATLPHLGDAIRFGLDRPHCRGIVFQPMFSSGRIPAEMAGHEPEAIGVGDVVVACVEQCPTILCEGDFTPLPCGDPNCHTICYLLRTPEAVVGLSRLVDLKSMQGFLHNRVDYRLEDLARCGCETEPLGDIIKGMELRPESPFRIFIKPFMDAGTFDQDRIDRCCTHVIRPDGSLDSFCRYYLEGGAAGTAQRRAAPQSKPAAVSLRILGGVG